MKIKLLALAFALAVSIPLLVGSVAVAGTCAGVNTAIIGDDLCAGATNGSDPNTNAIMVILKNVIKIMNVLVGIAAVGGIAYAGFLYATAADSAEQTKKSITVIRDAVIGLLMYVFMVVLLNYLVPGGVFT